MADGSESFVVARALSAAGPERIHAIRLLYLLRFSADSRRDSLLPARLGELLGSDDVFGGWLCFGLRDLDVFPCAKPVVHLCEHVARRSHRRTIHGAHQHDREMRASARRSVSLAARGRSGCGPLGSLAAQTVALLDIPSVRTVHVRFNRLHKKPLCGG